MIQSTNSCDMCKRTIEGDAVVCSTCLPKYRRKKRKARPVDRAACEKSQTRIRLTGSLESQRMWWWNMQQASSSDKAPSAVQSAPPNLDYGGRTKGEK